MPNRSALTGTTSTDRPPAQPWGQLAAIDLHGAELAKLADAEVIAAFIPALVEAIRMTAYGPLILERFGSGDLYGWSAMQLIETSCITMHCDEPGARAFIDVFSCKPFNSAVAAGLAAEFFGGVPVTRVLQRGT